MKLSNKLQDLLNDLLDKALRRKWHVRCMICHWEVRNLEHKRFASRRGKLHDQTNHCLNLNHGVYLRLPNTAEPKVWCTLA